MSEQLTDSNCININSPGFAQHRHEQKKNNGSTIGEMFIYFGCRHKALDFLYENQLNTLVKDETISKLYASFSRDADHDTKYVQV